jgi:hypothetical protein
MDVSLAIDLNKNIYALTALNAESKDYIIKNVNFVSYEGAILIEKDSVIDILKNLQTQGFDIEVWKNTPLLEIPEDLIQL